ncbi:MAG TPA: YihY/virulence factor BrkB family protein [Holophaga sp.]|nr:YihY/virulence factor BrkB family protein [Holophaga sp.]
MPLGSWLEGARGALSHEAEVAWRLGRRHFPLAIRFLKAMGRILRKYHQDDCWTYAASVSFFLTLSLIPLATLFFKLLALLMGSAESGPGIQQGLTSLYPFLPRGFLEDTLLHSRRLGGWGLSWAILLIGAHWGVNQVDRSLSHIFGIRVRPQRQTRRFHLLRRLGVVLVGLAFLVILLTAGFEWTLKRRALLPPGLAITVLPTALGFILVALILQHLPRRHVRFRHAALGALVTMGFWWLAKWGFGFYLAHTPTWGILYGSLGSLMAALVFLYYSCCIFLLGAEVTAHFDRQEHSR